MASSPSSPPHSPGSVLRRPAATDPPPPTTDSRAICLVALRAYERAYRIVGGDPDFATNIDYVTSRRRLEQRLTAGAWRVPEPQARRILSLVRSMEAAPPASLEAWFGIFTETVLDQLERRQAMGPARPGPRRRASDAAIRPSPRSAGPSPHAHLGQAATAGRPPPGSSGALR